MAKQLTMAQLDSLFPDDDTCLEHIFRTRYGDTHKCAKCGKKAKYYRVKARRAHECEHCGYQVYATVGTPFAKTRTPLTVWFKVMHMFCTTRNGVSAKEIQRATGVTYKTAWRMGHEIRKYMAYVDGDFPIGGNTPTAPITEVDKAFIGGKDKIGEDDKAVVIGLLERGGDIVTRVIPDRRVLTVEKVITDFIKPGSKIATDEARVFYGLSGFGYRHASVNHSKKEYVRGAVHTNSIEAFWANLKRGIRGTHVWVSKKHLQKYLCEFEYRHNLRKHPELMMALLLKAFAPPAHRKP